MKKCNALLAAFALSCATASAQSSNVIRVATDATFPPFEYSENNKMTGFDIELIEEIAKVMGKRVEWIQIDFKGLIPGLVAKRFDVAASAIYITDERKQVVNFTNTYYKGGLVIMTRKGDNTIKGIDDLKGKKVTVQIGTKSATFLQTNFPDVQRTEVETNQQMFNLVEVGRADAAVTGKPAALLYAKKGTLKVLPKQLTTENYGFAVRKDLPELQRAMNLAFAKLSANGTYGKLVKKWFK